MRWLTAFPCFVSNLRFGGLVLTWLALGPLSLLQYLPLTRHNFHHANIFC
jgi:hypothetical protein